MKIHFKPRTLVESSIKNKNTHFLLVVGLSRTGTSLLQRLLNAHPKIFISYESVYMPFIQEKNRKDIHAYYYELLKQHFHLCRIFENSKRDLDIKPLSAIQNYDYFGDKSIYNVSRGYRQGLAKAIKNRRCEKLVFILRDPRARVASLVGWHEKRNNEYINTRELENPKLAMEKLVSEAMQAWNTYVADVSKYSKYSDRVIVIAYENMIQYSEKILHDLMSFLGVNINGYDPSQLARVNMTSLDAWEKTLDPGSVALIEEQMADESKRFYYGIIGADAIG